MSDTKKSIDKDQVLDEETIELLSCSLESLDIPDNRLQSLRAKVMARVDAQVDAQADEKPSVTRVREGLIAVHEDEGEWHDYADQIKKKSLYLDKETGIETFLLRAEAGAVSPEHIQPCDEHCYVLEGDISFGDLHMIAGDYVLAAKGAHHAEGHTVHGALLLIQTEVQHQPSLI